MAREAAPASMPLRSLPKFVARSPRSATFTLPL
jgi:hypothetical protein